jgi:hypothetical protein
LPSGINRLKEFEYRVLKRIFRPKRDETTGGRIKLHEFYSPAIIIMMIKMGGACSTNVEKRNAFRLLAGKPEGKIPIGRRPRCRWVDNVEIGLGEIGWVGVNWIGLAQDRDK